MAPEVGLQQQRFHIHQIFIACPLDARDSHWICSIEKQQVIIEDTFILMHGQ